MYQVQYSRENSRDRSRSREKDKKKQNSNNQNDQYDRRHKDRDNKIKNKRVKQNHSRQLNSCSLSFCPSYLGFKETTILEYFERKMSQILKIKIEIQKEVSKSYDFNWENFKHRDAVSESNSMKEVKQRQKALSQKLMSMKQSIAYFNPPMVSNMQKIIELGVDSLQREGHASRISDILGCLYVSQTPHQPQFQILNTNTTSESKLIKFDNEIFSNDNSFGNNSKKNIQTNKPLKSILKVPKQQQERGKSQTRSIDPKLIYLIKQFQLNPSSFTKERREQLLKPYRDSGELDYLTKKKQLLEAILKNTSNPNPIKPSQPIPQNNPPQFHRQSWQGRQTRESNDRPQRQSTPIMSGFNPNFVPKADKFRTVPCKYYHSPQGCSKIDNCTFIHDQKYAGQPVPNQNNHQNMSMPMPMNNPIRGNPNFPPMYGYQPLPNNGGMPNMPPYMNNNISNQNKSNSIGYFGPNGNYPMQTHGHGYYPNSNQPQTPNSNNHNYPPMNQISYNMANQPPQYMMQNPQLMQQGQVGQNFNQNYQYMLNKGDQYQNQNK